MAKVGLDCKLYHNTGDYATPVWDEIDKAKDVTLNLEASQADASSRGTGGWRATVTALKDGSIEFELVWDPTDADFAALRNAFLNRTSIEMAVMDGDITTTGSEGLRATMAVTNFSRNEPLEDVVTASVTVMPTVAPNAPAWYVVP